MSLAGSAGFYFLGASVCIGAIITSRSLSSCLVWVFIGGGGSYHFNSCAFNYNGINLSLL